jgi:hypothetical protein
VVVDVADGRRVVDGRGAYRHRSRGFGHAIKLTVAPEPRVFSLSRAIHSQAGSWLCHAPTPS